MSGAGTLRGSIFRKEIDRRLRMEGSVAALMMLRRSGFRLEAIARAYAAEQRLQPVAGSQARVDFNRLRSCDRLEISITVNARAGSSMK
jgi:hypothetical protein